MSSFGHTLRVMTFGESHGVGVGCIVEGVPPGLRLDENDIQAQLNRRRPGQSTLTTARQETDRVEILSGTSNGYTLGTPIAMLVRNKDQRIFDYADTSKIPRPGHADYTYRMKYNGHVAQSGGGRASARETIGRVAAGSIAEKWLRETYGTSIVSWVSSVGSIEIPNSLAKELERNPPCRDEIEQLGAVMDSTNEDSIIATRCPHPPTAEKIALHILDLKTAGDSIGGIVTTVVKQVPIGLGEPCFDKIEAELAKAMMSLPATKGFEIGDGFLGTKLKGSEHNDRFVASCSTDNSTFLKSDTNHAGGTLGGITNGNNIVFRVAFKPVSSISQPQATLAYTGELSVLKIEGRHDPCVMPRTPPLIEAMTSLVICDLALRQRARVGPTGLHVFPQRMKSSNNVLELTGTDVAESKV